MNRRGSSAPPSAPADIPQRDVKTKTLPESQRGPWFEGPDVVTSLRVYGSEIVFELPRAKKSFTLGSAPDCDLAVPEKYLSSLHCLLERRGEVLRVHDQRSYNGTFFNGRRETVFDLRPGSTFNAASIRFLALNDEMAGAYPLLADILGSEDEHGLRASSDFVSSPSEAIVIATSGTNIVITGEAGCEQERLATLIHRISLVRGREPVVVDAVPEERAAQRAVLDRAARSTFVFKIGPKSPVADATFVSMLFSPSFHIRVVAIAPTVAKANDVLTEQNVRTMRQIVVRPLSQRSAAVPHLLDRMFSERGSTLRFAELTTKNQAALQAFEWPGNFDDLRLAADRLTAIAREGSILRASKAINVSTSTLHYWFTQLGMSLPVARPA